MPNSLTKRQRLPRKGRALKMRPTGLGHGVYRDNIDYSVFSEGWEIGRIYERAG